jgi:hypothetical protein
MMDVVFLGVQEGSTGNFESENNIACRHSLRRRIPIHQVMIKLFGVKSMRLWISLVPTATTTLSSIDIPFSNPYDGVVS